MNSFCRSRLCIDPPISCGAVGWQACEAMFDPKILYIGTYAQVREASLYLLQSARGRTSARLLRSPRAGATAISLQAKSRIAWIQKTCARQYVWVSRSVRTRTNRGRLSRCCVVRGSDGSRCRGDHRVPHRERQASRATSYCRRMPQRFRLCTPYSEARTMRAFSRWATPRPAQWGCPACAVITGFFSTSRLFSARTSWWMLR